MKLLLTIIHILRRRTVEHSGAGFTLIELLIVAALFSLSALIATSVFSNVQSSQRGLQAQQRVTSDGRYLLETMARSIRTGTINYKMYTATREQAIGAQTTFSTVDQQNIVTCYQWVPDSPGGTNYVLQVKTNSDATCSGGTWTTFTPSDLHVDSLKVYITPTSDPYKAAPRVEADCANTSNFNPANGTCTCTPVSEVNNTSPDCFSDMTCDATDGTTFICHNADVQPQVTIFLQTTSKNSAAGESATAKLQTTVVSRIYER